MPENFHCLALVKGINASDAGAASVISIKPTLPALKGGDKYYLHLIYLTEQDFHFHLTIEVQPAYKMLLSVTKTRR
jgi:hypothetical protein